MKKVLSLRAIDRFVIGLLAVLVTASGLYLVGPWYLREPDGSPSPIFNLLHNHVLTVLYGLGYIVVGAILAWCATRSKPVSVNLLSYALLVGFLMRLYNLIGAVLILDSWRPPNYLSATVLIMLFGGYWLWVRSVEGPI